MNASVKRPYIGAALFTLGVALVASHANEMASRETVTVQIPGGEVGYYETIAEPEQPNAVTVRSRFTGLVVPTALPATEKVKPGSTMSDAGRDLGRAAPTAHELEKLRLAREAVALSEAAGTRRLSPDVDVKQATSAAARAEKERRQQTQPPVVLDFVPGGAK